MRWGFTGFNCVLYGIYIINPAGFLKPQNPAGLMIQIPYKTQLKPRTPPSHNVKFAIICSIQGRTCNVLQTYLVIKGFEKDLRNAFIENLAKLLCAVLPNIVPIFQLEDILSYSVLIDV